MELLHGKYPSDEWICAHYADDYADRKGSVSPAIYQSSTHIFESCEDMSRQRQVKADRKNTQKRAYFYGRDGNPTVEILEQKLAALERTDACLCFGSGVAAITSVIMHTMKPGDHVITVSHAYGNHFLVTFLKQYGLETTVVDGTSIAEFQEAIRESTKLIYLESPMGATYALQDLEAVGKLAREHGIVTAIDNTWATPIHQKPHTLGIDLVIHSLSKYIGGHSDLIGGAVAGSWDHIMELAKVRGGFGNILHPQEGYLALRGLRTLPVRMAAHEKSGLRVAEYLEAHPKIVRVHFPGLASHPQYDLAKRQMRGFSSLMSIVMDAPVERAIAFVNSLKLFKIAVSWGGYESLIIEPRSREDDPNTSSVRLFVGQDNIDELLADLDQALTHL
jgi:cystathionine beta-lyase/cystathionine gamma-synthase